MLEHVNWIMSTGIIAHATGGKIYAKYPKLKQQVEDSVNPIQPGVSVHGTSPGGGKSYPPYKFSIKTVQMAIKFML